MQTQETSREARNWLEETGHAKNMRGRILAYIKMRGGATCDEVENDLHLRHQSASGAIRKLTKDEILRRSPITRRARSGRRAIVWEINDNNNQIELF